MAGATLLNFRADAMEIPDSLSLRFAGATDIGRRRQENQDRWLVLTVPALAVVADGMGGLQHGGRAAQQALDTLQVRLARGLPADDTGWVALLDAVNAEVHALGRQLGARQGIGSTLTLAARTPRGLTLAHVGDSAAFRLRGSRLEQLTPEHTVAAGQAQQRAAGRVPEPTTAPGHALTSCLGLPHLPLRFVGAADLARGDRLLLCSDGLHKSVTSPEIAELLGADSPLEQIVAALLLRANERGGPDNITAIVGAAW